MLVKAVIEAGIFLALATAVAVLVTLAVPAVTRWRLRSSLTVVITVAVLVSFLLTELWAQLSHLVRLSRVTLALCVLTAAAAAALQMTRAPGERPMRD